MTALVMIWGPLYILVTIIVTLVVYWLARRFTVRRWPSLVVLGLAIAWPVGDVTLTKLTLGEYCDLNEGSHVYEVVENVDGIYIPQGKGCAGICSTALLSPGESIYQFVEAHAGEMESQRAYINGLVPGPGLYRFTVEKKGHPNCKIYERWFDDWKGLHSKPNYQGICVATWPIEKISAQYEVGSDYEAIDLKIGRLNISNNNVTRISDGQKIFERIRYRLKSELFWSQFMNLFLCTNDKPFLTFRDVLKPSPVAPQVDKEME